MRNFLKKIFGQRNPASSASSVIKSRPVSLTARYAPLTEGPLCDEFFLRLKRKVYEAMDQGGITAHREAGKLASGRSYFYVKPFNQKGWLFERSGAGWVVAWAEKMAASDTFMRDPGVIDIASVQVPEDPTRLPRVQSPVGGGELISMVLYEERLIQSLGLKGEAGEFRI
jgi:hypothetical protein